MLLESLPFSKIIKIINRVTADTFNDKVELEEYSTDIILVGKSYSLYIIGESETLVMAEDKSIEQFIDNMRFSGVKADNILNVYDNEISIFLLIHNKWYKINKEYISNIV